MAGPSTGIVVQLEVATVIEHQTFPSEDMVTIFFRAPDSHAGCSSPGARGFGLDRLRAELADAVTGIEAAAQARQEGDAAER